MYDICYTKTVADREAYLQYIDEQYNADRLTEILTNVSNIIGANILNIAKQDYEPQGASVTILIAEGCMQSGAEDNSSAPGPLPETVLAHLDKSHITVHTYPEYNPIGGISTFRADIDVATCGEISPLNTLDYLIGSFDSDIITIDYRVRGFTRDVSGKKCFMDHKMTSIQDFIDPQTLTKYDAIDVNVYQSNIFHTKMLIKEIELQNYLFNSDVYEIHPQQRLEITNNLRREMIEIFSGMNIY